MNTGAPAAPPPVTGARLFKADQQHRRRHFLVCLLFRGSVLPPLPLSPQRLHVNMQQGTRDGYDRDVMQSRVGRTSLFRPHILLTSPAGDTRCPAEELFMPASWFGGGDFIFYFYFFFWGGDSILN